jgi:hypothetical protein
LQPLPLTAQAVGVPVHVVLVEHTPANGGPRSLAAPQPFSPESMIEVGNPALQGDVFLHP